LLIFFWDSWALLRKDRAPGLQGTLVKIAGLIEVCRGKADVTSATGWWPVFLATERLQKMKQSVS
jgi:hypothetical protein